MDFAILTVKKQPISVNSIYMHIIYMYLFLCSLFRYLQEMYRTDLRIQYFRLLEEVLPRCKL